jgi:DNA modification methylase
MTPAYDTGGITLYAGDCLDVLRELPDNSVDAVVTDPPYGLEFMGKEWDAPWKQAPNSWADRDAADHAQPENRGQTSSPFLAAQVNKFAAGLPFQEWCTLWTAECLRVLKPGGHLLAFGGTRTWHRLACAVEDAGFEVRDSIAWLYGSGFPKSLDVSKAIDKAAGATREVVGFSQARSTAIHGGGQSIGIPDAITAPATSDAVRWQGWGTALKPAFEPVVVARKPLAGTVAANVLAHGTGALNVDGCRVGTGEHTYAPKGIRPGSNNIVGDDWKPGNDAVTVAGRWPANVVLDESQAAALDAMSGESASARPSPNGGYGENVSTGRGDVLGTGLNSGTPSRAPIGDSGGASRFFYTAPQTPLPRITDPEEYLRRVREVEDTAEPYYDQPSTRALPIDDLSARFTYTAKAPGTERIKLNGTAHPTVKPLALMRWLVRLVTPPGGTVLEPFAGSGTTVEACILEGLHCVAIEREADYLPLIVQRINRRRDPVAAVKAAGEDGGLFDLLDGPAA